MNTTFSPISGISSRYSLSMINSGLYQTISFSGSSSGNINLQIGNKSSLSQGYIFVPYIMVQSSPEMDRYMKIQMLKKERKDKLNKLNKLL